MDLRAVLLLLSLVGCAGLGTNQARLTLKSNPPGATISGVDYENFSGKEPVTRGLQLRNVTAGQRTETVGPYTATWVSGATVTTNLSLTLGIEQEHTFQRPNVPGLQQDVQWAMHLQNKAAQSDDGLAEFLGAAAIGYSLGNRAAPPPQRAKQCSGVVDRDGFVTGTCR